ncbi:mannose-6-phosphate isomerase [Candidatus Pacearchaeota archaeon CG10_big_fil_rev_8_21_14_0_10_32_14]|nr:MAG: mannose-6-phosphate isomerase [Candidatus Pacearchaeota archaeon CG10_big_fil_rev_8_21_14_0_10_32_14]
MKKRLKNQLVDKRPWGEFEQFTLNENSTVKIITVKSKKRLSLQKHKNREEFWKVLDHPVKVTVGKKTWTAKINEEIFIPKNTIHRLEGLNKDGRILEIALGKFNENDIERVEDDYGRK